MTEYILLVLYFSSFICLCTLVCLYFSGCQEMTYKHDGEDSLGFENVNRKTEVTEEESETWWVHISFALLLKMSVHEVILHGIRLILITVKKIFKSCIEFKHNVCFLFILVFLFAEACCGDVFWIWWRVDRLWDVLPDLLQHWPHWPHACNSRGGFRRGKKILLSALT